MEVEFSPCKSLSQPLHSNASSTTTTRVPNPSPARYSFSYGDLFNALYRRRDVEVVKVDDVKLTLSPDKLKETAVCEICRGEPKRECPHHGPAVFPRRATYPSIQMTYAVSSFPDEVQLCRSSVSGAGYGVSAKQHIPVGTWIGPYEGRRIKPEEVTSDSDTTYMWEIFQEGKLVCYLDARDENTSSWMRFIRCARYRDEQNLYAFQYCGSIYYRAFRDIAVGQELLVWYDDKYQQYMGIPLNMQDMAIVDPNGNPLLFDLLAYHNQRVAAAAISSQSQNKTPQPHVTQSNHVTPEHVTQQPDTKHQSPSTSSHSVTQQGVTQHTMIPVNQMPLRTTSSGLSNVVTQINSVKIAQSVPVQVASSFTVKVTQSLPVKVTHSPTVSHSHKEHFQQSSKPYPLHLNGRHTQSLTSVTQSRHANQSILSSAHPPTSPYLFTREGNMTPLKELRQLQNTHEAPVKSATLPIHMSNQVTPHISREDKLALEKRLKEFSDLSDEYTDEEGIVEYGSNGEVTLWKCGQCKKAFAQRALLQIHVCPGMANRPFTCGHCSESFALSNELRTHVVQHTNEKPFKCGFCSRTFAGITTLNNHIRTHTGEKPFNCYKCGKHFSQPSQLSRHQRCPTECRL
ncbi:putative histone-lysine N-methyltransferase PRDM6 [Nematostella vectensis]|uniref:putative histone-lysine N-methyltransferase PRDM6 n=1 Tax=Nematostella vectensis TaxID=45351 RepID=UPI00138FF962|nr:putative histone-lysine N-methyltransferase PRDM6 [Nematostella vectensis]